MRIDLKKIYETTSNKIAWAIRIFLGGMFVMTGAMKLFGSDPIILYFMLFNKGLYQTNPK